METGKPVRFEDVSPDNGYVDSTIYPVFDAAGRVDRLAVYTKDITENKQASLALAESETRFKQVFDSISDGVSLRDARTFELIDANQRFCEMYGYTLEELKALPLGSLGVSVSADQRRKQPIDHFEQASREASILFQNQGRRKDGSTFWLEAHVRWLSIGTRDCLLSALRDITERRGLKTRSKKVRPNSSSFSTA